MARDNLTESEFARLNACRSEQDWADAVTAIKDARDDDYPADWYERMLATGLMDRICGRFGQAGFAITSFGTNTEFCDALEGKTTQAKTELIAPPHDYDGKTILMEPVRARLLGIGHAQPDLPLEVRQLCGLFAEHMGGTDRLNEMGVAMSFILFQADLLRGINGYTRQPMESPIAMLPAFLHAVLISDLRDNLLPSVLPDGMREKVADYFSKMDKEIDAAIKKTREARAETDASTTDAAKIEADAIATELVDITSKAGG